MSHDVDALLRGTTTAAALDLFDAHPPVAVEEILGRWRGSEVPTGHPLDGLLAAYGWHGKDFRSADDVDPLVMSGGFALQPAVVPLGLAVRWGPVLRRPLVAGAARRVLPFARTRRPAARLRTVEHRGVAGAAMVYDRLPVIDHFRRLDDDTLLGAMDQRGVRRPFVFLLRREA